jgi:hypothetical protein
MSAREAGAGSDRSRVSRTTAETGPGDPATVIGSPGVRTGTGAEELFGLGHRHVEAFMTARRWPHSIRGLPRPGQSGRRAG